MTKTLLLVDKNSRAANDEKKALENYGYEIITAGSGSAALDAVFTHPEIQLILMDIDLGSEPDGAETAAAILKLKDLPIIFLSDHREPEIIKKTDSVSSYGYVLKESGITVINAAVKIALNLFEFKTMKSKKGQELIYSEVRYSELFKKMNNSVAIYRAVDGGEDFIITDFNPAAEKLEKINRDDIIGHKVTEIFPGVREFGILEIFRKVWKTGQPRNHPVSFYTDNKISGWRENYVYKLPTGEIVSIYEDKTEMMQAQEAIFRSEEQLRTALMDLSFIVVTISEDGTLTFCNDYLCRLTGWKREEIIGRNWFQTFVPDDVRGKVLDETFTKEVQANGPPSKYENEILTKTGERRLITWSNTVFRNNVGNKPSFTSVGEDITNQKENEQLQKERIREKEILLKEVHHRIKNNMATMRNLLELQALNLNDESAKKQLMDAAGRMNSMSLLYDRLYTSEQIQSFMFSDYLESLINDILSSYNADVDLQLNIENIVLAVHKSSILGILINEIITNSMKYAFRNDRENILVVTLKSNNNRISLMISDNGPGFNPDELSKGFGHKLIRELTKQLSGKMDISFERGTRYDFEFPAEVQQFII